MKLHSKTTEWSYFILDSKIQDMIKKGFNECTVLTIAHRLNAILHCDKILVMDKGEVRCFFRPL